jgi:hypothetical protein
VVGRGCHLGRGGVKIDDAEVSAIAEALQIVQEKITIGNTVSRSASAVVVYSNSEAALIRIRDFRSGSRFQVGLIVSKAITQIKMMRRIGVQVILR